METLNQSPKIVHSKRVNYLEWQEYFMSIAFLSAQRSKDPRTQTLLLYRRLLRPYSYVFLWFVFKSCILTRVLNDDKVLVFLVSSGNPFHALIPDGKKENLYVFVLAYGIRKVGACIVNQDNKVVGIGYNGMPMGCHDDNMPWNKAEDDSQDKWLQSKSPYVCHAELNAVLNKNLADIKGCVIYVALFPCNMCAQIIIQSGIKEVVYFSDKYHDDAKYKASRYLLETAGVQYRQFRPRQKKIIIDFESIEDTAGNNSLLSSLTTCDNKEEFTTNNNNTGIKRTFFVEERAEHEQLQNHLDHVEQVAQFVPVPIYTQKEALELKFAIVSLLLIAFVAFFSWYLSDPKLTR